MNKFYYKAYKDLKDNEFIVMTRDTYTNIVYQLQKIDKAIEYINKTQMPEGYKKMLLEILGGNNETI